MKHHVVSVDGWVKLPPMNFDYTETQHPTSTLASLPERVADATIIISSATQVPREAIAAAPHLRLVAVNGVGVDKIDLVALQERGIWLCNVPAQNTESVSEHAFALYFALKRRVLPLHKLVLDSTSWLETGALHLRMGRPPRTCGEEVLVVVGYGAIGQHIAKTGRALGMTVLIAERKDATIVREGRTAFTEALTRGTLFMLVAPLDESTRDMIGANELATMDAGAMIVNVGRGGVIDEAALATALREKRLGGAATDVFAQEPATRESSPLLDPEIPNLVLTPHIAWYASKTVTGTIATAAANLEAFAAGKPQNVVLEGNPSFLQDPVES